jgi:S1-C subfamily serine protease
MSEIEQVAAYIANNLDSGNKDAAATALSQQAAGLQREQFRTLVKAVDRQEQDGKGFDMTVKIAANGVPEHYAVLPAVENGSAKLMAQFMDEGKGAEAQALMNQVMESINVRDARDYMATVKDFRLWAMAVDSYENDGVGHDVSIDLKKSDITSVGWQMEVRTQAGSANLSMGGDSVDIPALILDKPAGEGEVVSLPIGSAQAKLYEQAQPSVVALRASRPGHVRGTQDISMGSGFVVGEDGLIATNDHTVFNFNEVTVLTEEGAKSYVAKVVAEDRANDLALLKIEPKYAQELKPLPLEASSGNLAMNQPLTAFGHAKGWARTYMSAGTVIGATQIGKVSAEANPPGENMNKQVVVLQAHGEDGGSGGPVMNDSGHVVGLAELAADSDRGQHIFMTKIEPLNELIKKYRGH